MTAIPEDPAKSIIDLFNKVDGNELPSLFKHLSAKEKETLTKVLAFVQTEGTFTPNEEDVQSLKNSIRELTVKRISSKESNSDIVRVKKGIQNIFGRVSSKDVGLAYTNRLLAEGKKLIEEKKFAEAKPLIQKAMAEALGNREAPYEMALLCDAEAKSTGTTNSERDKYITLGAERGDPRAQRELGLALLQKAREIQTQDPNLGDKQNFNSFLEAASSGKQWLEKAARKKDPEALLIRASPCRGLACSREESRQGQIVLYQSSRTWS